MTARPVRIAIFACIATWLGVWPTQAQEGLPQLIKRIQPAVVTVVGYNEQGRVVRLGSGFFISPDGHLVTNLHVVYGVARAEAKTATGAVYPLKKVVAADRNADLVKFAAPAPQGGFSYLKIDAAAPETGERVLALGSPMGLEQTVSDGMVSGIRQIPGRGEILQISAPISPGSSGGPVVNLQGEVVGVANFQIGRGQNLNFAIPGKRVLALQDSPARTLSEIWAGQPQPAPEGKPSLPARPRVMVPRPVVKSPQGESQSQTPEPLPLAPAPGPAIQSK